MTCAVQILELKKSYGSQEVLKGLSFAVERGEIFGILGVNGAGKTTALECIEGFRRYESGKIKVNGSCLLYTSPSPRDRTRSRMPSSA